MKEKERADLKPTPPQCKDNEKKQISQVIEFFSLYDGNSLFCADFTGISMCSVCYYLHDLLNMGIIGYVGKFKGRTGRKEVNDG